MESVLTRLIDEESRIERRILKINAARPCDCSPEEAEMYDDLQVSLCENLFDIRNEISEIAYAEAH